MKVTSFLVVIPSRYASTRLPAKALIDINGKSLVQRVYERCNLLSRQAYVCIATDDDRILAHAQAIGANVYMTSNHHKSGTDRCAELSIKMQSYTHVINVQGDEPFIDIEDIERMMDEMIKEEAGIYTLVQEMGEADDPNDPNMVKVALDKDFNALYFSRAAIPFNWSENQVTYYKHIGIYGFTRSTLIEMSQLPVGHLEQIESLEQLRWLENGQKIKAIISKGDHFGVDTPKDHERAILKAKNLEKK